MIAGSLKVLCQAGTVREFSTYSTVGPPGRWSSRTSRGRVDPSEQIKPKFWSSCGKILGHRLVQLKESVLRLCAFVSPVKSGFTSLVAERAVV